MKNGGTTEGTDILVFGGFIHWIVIKEVNFHGAEIIMCGIDRQIHGVQILFSRVDKYL